MEIHIRFYVVSLYKIQVEELMGLDILDTQGSKKL